MPAGIALTWGEMRSGSVLVEKDLCFETNSLHDIFAIIAEAELLEQYIEWGGGYIQNLLQLHIVYDILDFLKE
jgi:hypothetical protein